MSCNLFLNYYLDKSPDRQSELDFCLTENLKNESIDYVVLVCSSAHLNIVKEKFESRSEKIIPVILEHRPTYNSFFHLTRYFAQSDDLNIICNTDMIVPVQTIQLAPLYLKNRSFCLALSRWNIQHSDNYKHNAVLFDRHDSQDTWIFQGQVPNISGADFTLGVAGCDNKIAHLLEAHGYSVINPSRTLKTYHFHLTNVRNYVENGRPKEIIPPPYKLIPTTE
jgi:hypothetical protein